MYRLIRYILFFFPPERAHKIALTLLHIVCAIPLGATLLRKLYRRQSQGQISVLGLDFSNRVGLAAGFDKNAEHVDQLSHLGFGFIEIGSVTARSASGNLQPRLFRLKDDSAIINRMGLNNEGAEAIAERVRGLERKVPLFINIAKTHDPSLEGRSAIEDYCASVSQVKSLADVLVINISCPNSGDGRTFEDPESLSALLPELTDAIGTDGPPFLIKVSPDLDDELLHSVVSLSVSHGASGFTATNTTVSREGLSTPNSVLDEIGNGGLSGAPLHHKSLHTVRRIRTLTDLPIVGVGGIVSVDEARAFMDAGADLVQVYSGFIYEGPTLIRDIAQNI